MVISDNELIVRVRNKVIELGHTIHTYDPTARGVQGIEVVERADYKDWYMVTHPYGGSIATVYEGSLYELCWDMKLLAQEEYFESGILDTGNMNDMIVRSSVLRPPYKRTI